MGDPAPRSIPAQPATPSTHASRAHLPLFSHFSLLSAHSFPSPLALRNHLVYTREAVSHALPRTLHAHPPPPTARHLRNRASPPFPHPASRPVSDQSLPLETPPPHPLATSAHPASLAPSSRPLTAPTFVANPPKNLAQAISRHTALAKPLPPTPHPGPPVAARALARPRFTRRTPRRTSRVFWKKLLRAQAHPISCPNPPVPRPRLAARPLE